MRGMLGLAVVGLGLLCLAGCECACTQNACPMPENVRDEITAQMAPERYPSVTMSGEVRMQIEAVD